MMIRFISMKISEKPTELNCIDILTFGSSDIKVRVMVFNATFINVSVISWWSVILAEETGVSVENRGPVANH